MRKAQIIERIRVLKIALKAIHKRRTQLYAMMRYSSCPLCKALKRCCHKCPVDESNKGLILSCEGYVLKLDQIDQPLIAQKEQFKDQIKMLEAELAGASKNVKS